MLSAVAGAPARPGAAGGAGTGGGGGGGVAGRVFVLGPDGKPTPVNVALGISDGTSTEVLRGGLREGQEVVVGAAAGGSGRPAAGGPRLRL